MSLLLAGGGLGPGTREALGRFVRSARERAEREPRLVVLADGDPTGPLVELLETAGAGGVEVHAAPGPEVPEASSDAAREALLRADGVLLVGTSAVPLLGLVREAVVDLRRLVSEELPFVGIAAGAAVAGQSAVLGGTVLDGVRLAPSDDDEPAEVAVVAGLGLVDVTIDTGGATAGLLGRVLALVESGTVDRALVIDGDTVLAVADGSLDVFGTGSVWQARLADNGEVVVSSAHHGIES